LGEETIKDVLKNLQLTDKEGEVYIFLSKHGVLKCNEIAKGMKRHKAQIYRILNILQIKGLLESTLEAPARFTAVPFETVLDLSIKAKRDEAAQMETTRNEILTYWKSIHQPGLEPPTGKFVVIEGDSKIYAKIAQMIRDTKSRLSVVVTVPGLVRADQIGLFDTIFTHPLKSKIQIRFVTDVSNENLNTVKSLLKELHYSEFNLKGRNPELGLQSPRMVIRDNDEILFFITPRLNLASAKQDVCLWTDSKELVLAFSAVFEDFWRNSTDIKQKIAEIESGRSSQRMFINNEEEAEKTYHDIVSSAKKRILVLTSSQGLATLFEDTALTETWKKRGISAKIMAPITSENLESAEQLSKICAIRHIPLTYLETTIVDGKHLFQFGVPSQDQARPQASRFEEIFYTNDPEQVKRARIMLASIWKNASFPSTLKLKTVLSPPPPTVVSPASFRAFLKRTKKTPVGPVTVGQAIICPPSNLGMPAIKIQAYDYGKDAQYGGGCSLIVYLRLKKTGGYDFVPVAIVLTNAGVVDMQKALFAGTPAAENIQLVTPGELQIRKQGNTLFAGWTVQIPLPPTTHQLPPSCILFEAYGTPRHTVKSAPEPSGHITTWESDTSDAFITFLDQSWRYAGPGTQGLISTNATVTLSEPELNQRRTKTNSSS
jgi:sugar-specific transcriptional regulator TrmB